MGVLQDKVALVTGASNGVGEATALRFASEGARVALCSRDEDSLERVAAAIREAGGEALVVAADVTDESAVRAAVNSVAEHFGGLDILVNNANVLTPGMLSDHDLDSWRSSFRIAVDAPMLLMREAFPFLSKNGGSVVNVSSVCGELATPGVAGYSAAKAALQSLTRNAAIEWSGAGVRVNAIVIGIVMSPASEMAIPDEAGRIATARSIPIGRIGEPREAANAILFLASDEASYITGVELPVDGGRSVELATGAADWEE